MYTIKILTFDGKLVAKLTGRTAHQLVGSAKDSNRVITKDGSLSVTRKIFNIKEEDKILKVTEDFKAIVGELTLYIDKGYHIKEA